MADKKQLLDKGLLEQQYGINKLDSIQEQQSYIEADSFFGSRKIGKNSNEAIRKQSIGNQNNRVPIFSLRNPFVLVFEFFIYVITYLVFIIYIVESFYEITVLPQGAADQTIKGLIFFCFFLQIILKFNISIIIRGKEISDRRVIKFNYIRQIYNGRLFWDCISILGLLIDTFNINFSYKWLTYLLFYSKAVFMWEFDVFALQFLQLRRRTLAIYKLFRLIMFIYFNVNLAACIFYQVGIQTLDIYGANWIQGIPYANINGEIKWIYLYSIYWSFATMATVAYGDVTPKNPIETIYACFIMAGATLQFGYTINQVIDIISNISQGKEKVEKQITAIQRYMRNKNVNQELRYRVVHYVEYQLMEDKERDLETEQHIIGMLPPNLRAELFYEINGFFFKNFDWTYKFSDQFISALCYEIEEVNIMEQTVLYEPSYVESEDDISLFYIAKGQVELKVDLPQFNKGQGIKLNLVTENNFIGLYSFVTGTLIKEVLFCKTAVKVFIIRRQKFLDTIKNFDQDYKLWNIYSNRIIQERKYEEFGLYCYNCLTTDHIIEECDLMSRKKTMLDKRQQNVLQIRVTTSTQRNTSFKNKITSGQDHVSSSQLQQELRKSSSNPNQDEKKVQIQEANLNENNEEIKEQIEDEGSSSTKIKQDIKKSTSMNNKNEDQTDENIGELEKEKIKTIRQGMGSKIQSKVMNDSFIQFQEQNINEHIKHEVYNEDEHDKWAQRAKIKERIDRKQAFQSKRIHTDQDDIVYQIVSSIQNILLQNNIDLNLMQNICQENPPKRRTSWQSHYTAKLQGSFNKQ